MTTRAGTLRWLHISDIHLGSEDGYGHSIVLRALIAAFHSGGTLEDRRPDVIFCTGDVAQSGKRDQYAAARQFFEELARATGVPRERIFVVPGNHDVDRTRVSRAIHFPLGNRDDADNFFGDDGLEAREVAFRRFSDYADFQREVFGRAISHDRPYLLARCHVSTETVGVIGLNTAWLAHQNDAQGKLVIGERLVRQALDELDASEPATVRVALLHHPLDWIRDFERDAVKGLLFERVDYILHGHLHAQRPEVVTGPEGRAVVLAAGAMYQGRAWPSTALLVELDATEARVEAIMFREHGQGIWMCDPMLAPRSGGVFRVPRGAHQQGLPAEPAAAPRAAPGSGAHAGLLGGIDALPQDWSQRIGAFVDAYTGTPERPNVFCGREDDVAQVNAWLARADASANLVLTAPAGRGKSALLVRVAMDLAARNDVAVAFIPLSVRFDTNRPDVFLGCLAARLAALHGRKAPDLRQAGGELLQRMVVDDLSRPLPDGRVLVVILDGVDEAVGWHVRPGILPAQRSGMNRIIVSARHQPDDVEGERWLRKLGWDRADDAETLTLPLLDEADVARALGQLRPSLRDLAQQPRVVSKLTRLCAGEPLTLWLVLGGLVGPADLSALDSWKPGLTAWFERWWEEERARQGTAPPGRERSIPALLDLLSVADGGLTREDILALAPEEIPSTHALVDETLPSLHRLVHGDGKRSGYVMAHPGLAAHLRERLTEDERQQWRGRLHAWSSLMVAELADGRRPPENVPRYVVERRSAQLHAETASPERWMELVKRPWYDAWQAHDQGPSGFLDGLGQTWSVIAAAAGEGAKHLPELAECALVKGTIGSISANVNAEMLDQILAHGLWTPEQALAYVRTAPVGHDSSEGRGHLVLALAPYAPVEFLPQLLDIVCALWGKPFSGQDEVIKRLFPALAEVAPEATLVALRKIEPDGDRVHALGKLAAHLAPPMRALVVEEIRRLLPRIPYPAFRAQILIDLAELVPEPERARAFEEAFVVAKDIPEAYPRCRQLVRLVAAVPAASEEALAAACADDQHREYLLADLARQLPEPGRARAVVLYRAEVEAAREPHEIAQRWRTLLEIDLAEREAHIDRAVSAIAAVPDPIARARALETLLGRDDPGERPRAKTREWRLAAAKRALSVVSTIEPPGLRLSLLWSLAEVLPPQDLQRSVEELWPAIEEGLLSDSWHHWTRFSLFQVVPVEKVLAITRRAPAASLRVELLTDVARRLPPEQRAAIVEEAFASAREVSTPQRRGGLLLRLLSVSPPAQQEALHEALCEATSRIADAYTRCLAWLDLARLIDAGSPLDRWRSDALEAAHTAVSEINRPHLRLDFLLDLARLASGEEQRAAWVEEAAQEARQPSDYPPRARRLCQVASFTHPPRHCELVREALDSTSLLDDEALRVDTMLTYAGDLPLDELDALADCLDELRRPGARASSYVQLLGRCPGAHEKLFARALAAARATGHEPPDRGTRASFLSSLIGAAPSASRRALLREVLDEARKDLASVERLPDVALLEDPHLRDYGDWRSYEVDRCTADALTWLAPCLPEEWIQEALAIAGGIVSIDPRTRAMTNIALRLGEPERSNAAEEMLAAPLPAHFGVDPHQMRRQLAGIAASLLPVARRLEVESELAGPPGEPPWLWPDLPDDMLFDRIGQWLLPHNQAQATPDVIARALHQMPPERREPMVLWLLERASALSASDRTQILVRILSIVPDPWVGRYLDVAEVSGIGGLPALAASASRLDAGQLDRALVLLEADQSSGYPRDARLEALGVVGGLRLRQPLPPRVRLRTLLVDILSKRSETRPDALATLSAMQPLVVGLGGATAAVGVVRAIQRVGRSWP